MENILHVIDMSPCVYAGMYNKYSFIQGNVVNTVNGHTEQNIPTGGASMLFNILGQYMADKHIMFIADRNPSVKKEIYPDYKACRTHPDDVQIGKEVAEYILQDCGFTVHARDGYEADDIIYTIVMKNKKKFDHVYVHTADSDLYTVVCDNVSILPTSSRAKTVTMDNYSYMCKRNENTLYNTVVFNKFLEGDASKNLPPMPMNDRIKIVKQLKKDTIMPRLGNVGIVDAMLHEFPEYRERCRLFYPILMEEDFDAFKVEGDKTRIQEWAYEIRNRKVPQIKGDLSIQISELMHRGLYLERV